MIAPASVVDAVELQLNWLAWGRSDKTLAFLRGAGASADVLSMSLVMPQCMDILASAATFAMNGKFFDLVESTRRDVPDDIRFDATWLQARRGFVALPRSLVVPPIATLCESIDALDAGPFPAALEAAGLPARPRALVEALLADPEACAAVVTVLRPESWGPQSRWLGEQALRRVVKGDHVFDAVVRGLFDEPVVADALLTVFKAVNFRQLRAIGWRPVTPGTPVVDYARTGGSEVTRLGRPGEVQVVFFQARVDGSRGFYPWSHFILAPDEPLGAKIAEFERVNAEANDGSSYQSATSTDWAALHELRWFYAAAYLMAQRLATVVLHAPDRATRRRASARGLPAPEIVRVITLRRLEQDRASDATGKEVDWQWQWDVRGHWRQQYYASDNTHRPVFIESYVKGPTDKPFKAPGIKVFRAAR